MLKETTKERREIKRGIDVKKKENFAIGDSLIAIVIKKIRKERIDMS